MKYRLIDYSSKPYARKYLQSIYVLSNETTVQQYGCVPNGEIGISIITAGEGYMQIDGIWKKHPRISVYGLVKQVQFHRMSAGYREVNIGFDPQFLQLCLKDSMSSLLARSATDLYDLFRKEEVDRLYEEIMGCRSDQDILCRVESWLERHVRPEKIDSRVFAAHQLICEKNVWKVEALSATLNISPTGLRNLFREKMGISPKELIQIQRIKKALHTRDHDEESLTHLALNLDYYDQSHFIHHFKQAVGLTPRQYFSNSQLSFDFYNFARWHWDSFAATNADILK